MTSSTNHFPFAIAELPAADDRVESLFRKSFGAPAPTIPRHFIAFRIGDLERAAGYVHYTSYGPGLFLLGGLCVDASIYRMLSSSERRQVSDVGSLSRWLMKQSIAELGAMRAVFGYTGDVRSRRDILAIGFTQAAIPYLFAQWHSEPTSMRERTIGEVAALGPF